MIFYLTNLLLALYQRYIEKSVKMQFVRIITNNVKKSSVIFRNSRVSATLDTTVVTARSARESVECSPKQELVPPECSTQLWADSDIEVLCVEPQLHVNLADWTSYLGTQDYVQSSVCGGNCHILLEVSPPEDPQGFLEHSMSIPPAKRVKVMDLAQPLAWKSGTPFNIVAECTLENMAQLGLGLKEGRLLLDDMLELHCITSVCLHGRPISLLRTNSKQDVEQRESTSNTLSPSFSTVERQKSWSNILDSLHSVLEEEVQAGAEALSDNESNESLASLPLPEGCDEDEGNKKFKSGLTPQHEQILKLKEMNEATRDIDSGTEGSSVLGDTTAGEAPADMDMIGPDMQTPVRRRDANKSKPPNVLVYCGDSNATKQFETVSGILGQCLNPERYTVYQLNHDQVRTTPWQENTVLLVISGGKLSEDVGKSFLNFFNQGGTILSLTSTFDYQFVECAPISKISGTLAVNYKHLKGISVICGQHTYKNTDPMVPDVNVACLATDSNTDKPVIVETSHELSGGVAILSQVSLDRDPGELGSDPEIFATLKQHNRARFEILTEIITQIGLDCSAGSVPDLTPCYLLPANKSLESALLNSIKSRLKNKVLQSSDLSLVFCSESDVSMATVTKETVPVCTDYSVTPKTFNSKVYQQHLSTKILGQVVMYAEVVNTTMNLFQGMMFSVPTNVGLIAIASRQTAGQGRGGNAWISPVGCAMFSLHIRVPIHSPLGQRVAFIQHIASLAVVRAVTEQQGYQDINLRLKWPNDIYFSSTMKLGGVLVKSSVMADVIHANIGCGFNVTNTDPTICINDLIRQHNASCGANLQPFTVEELLARTVSHIEKLIGLFQSRGREAFLELYYAKWLHSNAPVHIENENLDVTIVGLDEYGYLSVSTPDGSTLSVHDDGNSFDMMRNLIVPKPR